MTIFGWIKSVKENHPKNYELRNLLMESDVIRLWIQGNNDTHIRVEEIEKSV